MDELDGICVPLGRLVEEPTCDPTTLPPPLFEIARLTEVDWLANSLWLIEVESDVLVDALRLSDVEADRLADSLGVMEAEAVTVPAEESLVVVDPSVVVELFDAAGPLVLVDSLVEVDWLVVVEPLEAAEPLVVAEPLVEVDPDAASSLVVCDVELLADCVTESLVAPVLPGERTVLPSVARVLRLVAVTSYEMGVRSDMIYSPFLLRALKDRTGETSVALRPFDLDRRR